MSYEGYEQHLCKAGHQFDAPHRYAWSPEPTVCPHCGEVSVWLNAVDETNCESAGVIPPDEWAKFRLTENVFEVCNLGHRHLTTAATYRTPSEEERQTAQHYRDYQDDGSDVLRPLPRFRHFVVGQDQREGGES